MRWQFTKLSALPQERPALRLPRNRSLLLATCSITMGHRATISLFSAFQMFPSYNRPRSRSFTKPFSIRFYSPLLMRLKILTGQRLSVSLHRRVDCAQPTVPFSSFIDIIPRTTQYTAPDETTSSFRGFPSHRVRGASQNSSKMLRLVMTVNTVLYFC